MLYDWLGCWATPKRFWKPLHDAGADVRVFAPASLRFGLNLFRRDHRKLVATDGDYASVAGMCIGDEWAGDPETGARPWRDTGVEFRGPVVAAIEGAFSRSWKEFGSPLPPDELPDIEQIPRAGDVSVRVVEGEPGRSRIYRLQQFISVGVERRLWITDPYFVAPPAMMESLAAAARDGVDVRVIVPEYNNWPVVGGMSRAGYRSLLAAGVRLFEWEGPMIHAKTSVADGIWSRIGSSNLNLASLLGNWELDVAILGRDFAAEMEQLFERDLLSCREVVLLPDGRIDERRVVERRGARGAAPSGLHLAHEERRRARRGSTVGRILGRIAQSGSVLSRALVGQRMIGPEDRGWVVVFALLLLGITVLGFLAPRFLAWPIAFAVFWLGFASLFRVLSLRERRRATDRTDGTGPPRAG